MYHELRRLVLVACLLALGTAAHVDAANLIPAPGFDDETEFLANWESLSFATWTDLDFEENPLSGSVLVSNTIPGADTGAPVITPCLPVTPGKTYTFSAWQYQPSPRPVEGYAQLIFQWLESCPSGALMGGASKSSFVLGAWTFISGMPVEAPVGALGARLWLNAVRTPASGTFNVYFDEAFVPEPGESTSAVAAALSLAILWRRRGSALGDGPQRDRTSAY